MICNHEFFTKSKIMHAMVENLFPICHKTLDYIVKKPIKKQNKTLPHTHRLGALNTELVKTLQKGFCNTHKHA